METTIKMNAVEARIVARMLDMARECGVALELERASIDLWEVTVNGVRHLVTLPQADLLLWVAAFGE